MGPQELLPTGAGLVLEHVQLCGEAAHLFVHSSAAGALCPACGVWSQAFHSGYGRTIADLPIAAVEIVVSHEVDDAKAFELGLPWIEVDGAAVCESGGRVLVPLRDKFLPWLCEAHAHRRGVARREGIAADRMQAGILRALPYKLTDFPGYRIEGTTLCPHGHDALVFAWDGGEPPWPRPPHVVASEDDEDVLYDTTQARIRRVLPFRRRWVRSCATCGSRLIASDTGV